jgi:hypothetical protein
MYVCDRVIVPLEQKMKNNVLIHFGRLEEVNKELERLGKSYRLEVAPSPFDFVYDAEEIYYFRTVQA